MALNFHDKSAVVNSSRLGKAPPVTRGLTVFNLDGKTAGQNQWIAGAGVSVVGSPEATSDYSTHYSVFNSLLTTMRDPVEGTYIVVVRVYASGRGTNSTLAGIYPNTGQPARGFGIGLLSSGSVFSSVSIYDGTEGGASFNTLATIQADEGLTTDWSKGVWKCLAAQTWSADGKVYSTIRDLTGGQVATASSPDGRQRDMRNGDAQVSIGQGRGNGQDMVGDKDMAASLLYSVSLTDDEINRTYSALKAYMSRRGIPI